MGLLFTTHDVKVFTATNNPPDRIDYVDTAYELQGNQQTLFGGKQTVELGLEGEARYRLNLDPDADQSKLTLSSKVQTRVIGDSGSWMNFTIDSKPTLNNADPELSYIELVLKEDVYG